MTEKPHYRATQDGPMLMDGLQSAATRLGTQQDKSATAKYVLSPLTDDQLEAAFRSSWACRKAVKIPAEDATRKWRQWTGPNTDAIEKIEKLFQLKKKIEHVFWKSRLYGGCVLLIGIRDQPLDTPLDPETVREGDLEYLTVLTRKEIAADLIHIDPRHPRYGLPTRYQILTTEGTRLYVHPSRLVEMFGEELPSSFVSGNANQFGWADSILLSIYEACRNLDATMSNIASLIYDAKTDVVKVPNLIRNIVDPRYEEALIKRFQLARMAKGNHGTFILDKEDEYEQKDYTFGGLHEVADRFMQVASGSASIPMTRFLEMSPGGLNSTGDSDERNYYDRIASIQATDLEPAMTTLDQVIIRTAGGNPDEDVYEWRPLRQMTEAEISEIRNKDAQTVKTLSETMIYADEDVAELGAELFKASGVDALSDRQKVPERPLPEEEPEEIPDDN